MLTMVAVLSSKRRWVDAAASPSRLSGSGGGGDSPATRRRKVYEDMDEHRQREDRGAEEAEVMPSDRLLDGVEEEPAHLEQQQAAIEKENKRPEEAPAAPPVAETTSGKSGTAVEILPGNIYAAANDEVRRQRAIFYRQAYRMTPDHFWRLHNVLLPHMKDDAEAGDGGVGEQKDKVGSQGCNGKKPRRTAAFRLSAALRHFAGGDSESDHCMVPGSGEDIEDYVREVVDAVHECRHFDLEYPACHRIQREIAACFEFLKSDVGLASCAGAVGSMLVWTEEPATGAGYYRSESKGRHGLHLQGVCDHEGRFLDVSVRPGSASDVAAFEESDMYEKATEEGHIAEGLALYGGEHYAPCPAIMTPLPAQGQGQEGQDGSPSTTSELREGFNFFQKQLSSQADAAFTSLLQRWGLLRRPLPSAMGTDRQRSLVVALCKLHNFCLADTEPMLSSLTKDLIHGLTRGSLFVGDMSSCVLLSCGNGGDGKDEEPQEMKQGAAKAAEAHLLALVKERAASGGVGDPLLSMGINSIVGARGTSRLF